MHEGQLDVTETLVRRLLADQLPAWADESVRLLSQSGTVNAIARVGEHLAARFALQPADPVEVRRTLEREADAARSLTGRIRVPSPGPLALGEPGHGYPLPWSVQTWVPGAVMRGDDPPHPPVGSTRWRSRNPSASDAFAVDLAMLVGDLRAIPTGGRTFVGERRENRGGTIAHHDAWVQACLVHSEGLLDVPRLAARWERLRDLPRGSEPDVTTHGDLVAGNVLVSGSGADARLAGLLDVGGVGPADPALDLVGAWHLLDDGPRQVFRATLGVGDAQWARGVAWAYEQAIGLVWYYRTSNPPMSALGRRTLERILRSSDELGP